MMKENANQDVWFAVKNEIELQIISGKYRAGDKTPTIVELMEQYDIGRATAQKVLTALGDEGIIVKRVRTGCFVRPYVREKLYSEHKARLEQRIFDLSQDAERLGIDKMQLLEMTAELLGITLSE